MPITVTLPLHSTPLEPPSSHEIPACFGTQYVSPVSGHSPGPSVLSPQLPTQWTHHTIPPELYTSNHVFINLCNKLNFAPGFSNVHVSPGSVTDTDTEIGIPNTEIYRIPNENTEKTINRYFNFVTIAVLVISFRPLWRSISQIKSLPLSCSNFTTKSARLYLLHSNIPALK